MPGKKQTVVYFIDNVHSSFVISDINELSKRFEKIILFSVDPVEGDLKFPGNVIVYQQYLSWEGISIKHVLKSNLADILLIYTNECFKTRKLLPLKKSFGLLASNVYKAQQIQHILRTGKHDLDNALFYSFWFYDCIFLAWLARKKTAGKAYARAHGGDLFEERPTLKDKTLFRHFQFKYLNRIYSVSEIGRSYLQKKYPAFADKMNLAYLGTPSQTSDATSDTIKEEGKLNLLSCGNIVNGKRLYLIADALFECSVPVSWTHFGKHYEDDKSGEFLSAVERLRTKQNITVSIKGSVPHEEIITFYKKHHVHLFISLSEAEGIPVTMMEACSFGVPVLSTDVGGCKEIVNERTGILVDKNVNTKAIAGILNEFPTSKKNTDQFRAGVREFWEENFDIKKNYDLFCESISRN